MGTQPDKRTTAYENIFGRPSVSHTRPQQWQQQQQQQHLHQPLHLHGAGGPAFQSAPLRWNSMAGHPQGYPDRRQPSPQPPGYMLQMSSYYPQGMAAGGDPVDRRASVSPSLRSGYSGSFPNASPAGPRMSLLSPDTTQSSPQSADSAAAAAAAAYYGGSGQYTAHGVPPGMYVTHHQPEYGGAGPSAQALDSTEHSPSPRISQSSNLPLQQAQGAPYPAAYASASASTASISTATSVGNGTETPTALGGMSTTSQSVSPLSGASFASQNSRDGGGDPVGGQSVTPGPPRLPSIEFAPEKRDDWGWGMAELSISNRGGALQNPPSAQSSHASSTVRPGAADSDSDAKGDDDAYGGIGAAMQGSSWSGGSGDNRGDEQFYTLRPHEWQSAGSSIYEGQQRRRGSVESDRRSIANSVYTLPGGDPSALYYPHGSTMYGSQAPSFNSAFTPLMPLSSISPSSGGWDSRTPQRHRTASVSTNASGPYGYGMTQPPPAEWRRSSESVRVGSTPTKHGDVRSLSFTQGSRLPDFRSPGYPRAPSTQASSPATIPLSARSQPQTPGPQQSKRAPLVYPALLSRVAEAFKMRVNTVERAKDGLSYKDAFDGREAVDVIAYIIKTTDRNLALLLGRALDAQKFFHDVTYDHRLRDSPNELYQFRQRLPSPFVSADENYEDGSVYRDHRDHGSGALPPLPKDAAANVAAAAATGSTRSTATTATTTRTNSTTSSLAPSASVSSVNAMSDPELFSTPPTSVPPSDTTHGHQSGSAPPSAQPDTPLRRPASISSLASEEDSLPCGVFTLLTDCYSPTCTRDKLCYSIACPRRLEQQAKLNMKPQPGLQRSVSSESLGEVKEPGTLWVHSVPKEVLDKVSDTEKKRQEAINEVIYTERDFVKSIEYLRDVWIKPLRNSNVIPEERRDDFITQVFWNVLEIHSVNSRLSDLLTRRQKQQHVVERIGDILLEVAPLFEPFVKYGAHQLYGKYEFEKEKGSNPAFAKFVEDTERLPESNKLELNGYLTKPTTRLARYPLLLGVVLKYTPEDSTDQQPIQKVIKIVREFLAKVNLESGKSENRFNLAQLDQQLVFKQGEAVDLRLRDEQRELVFKGPLKKRGGTQSDSAELQVFLFDHALLMVKQKTVHKNDQYKVYRKPIPLELLTVTVYDDVPTGKGSGARQPKSVVSRTSTGTKSLISGPALAIKQDNKQGYALTFTYLGKKGYTITLWAQTFVSRQKWFENIEKRQQILRERSNVFETLLLSEGFFSGANKVVCAVPFDFGRRIIYGTDDGVYLSTLGEKAREPIKVLPLPGVTQVDVLEEYQILIVLAEKSVHTFNLDSLDPSDPIGSLKRGRRISSHTSFFRAGTCLGRTLVCVVKSSSLSSTIKTLEPIDQNVRGKKQPTFRKLLQGGNDALRVFKEFYIPTESSSIHFLKSKLCVGCTKGFEIVDLETLDTQGLLDPADTSLDFVQRRENVKPIAIYRIEGEFLLCYDEFAFYVNKNGWRAKQDWIIHWEGSPTSFALHLPYVLAFEPTFVEVRHVETGALHQIITGSNLRCLFADTPPTGSTHAQKAAAAAAAAQAAAQAAAAIPAPGPYGMHPYGPHPRQAFGYGGPAGRQQPIPGYPHQPGGYGMGYAPPRPPPMAGPGYPPDPYTFARQQAAAHARAQAAAAAAAQRNPVWESVAASRGQIVFVGDDKVMAIKLADGLGARKSERANGHD